MTKSKRVRYTLEFKQEAVRLVESGQSQAEAARSLGVVEQTLGNWVKAHRAGTLKGASSMFPDPIAQGLLNHAQAPCNCCLALTRLNKPRRLLLELKRVTSPLRLRHLRYPFALEQLASLHHS